MDINEIYGRMVALEQRVSALEGAKYAGTIQAAQAVAAAPALPAKLVETEASDYELDGQWGNPEVRSDPTWWSKAGHPTMVGKKFSECTPEYLRALAKRFEWMGDQDDDKKAVDEKGRPKSYWPRKNASYALGWARRIEARSPRAVSSSTVSRKEEPMPFDPNEADLF